MQTQISGLHTHVHRESHPALADLGGDEIYVMYMDTDTQMRMNWPLNMSGGDLYLYLGTERILLKDAYFKLLLIHGSFADSSDLLFRNSLFTFTSGSFPVQPDPTALTMIRP